jgi:anhydro-N-acetylmuramic acid kinase
MIKLFNDAEAEAERKFELEDLLCTSCMIAADAILESMRTFLHPFPDEVIVSGGGTKNRVLMHRLATGAAPVKAIEEIGFASEAKEAMAFALLGAATLDGFAGNVPSATGASRAVVLGAVTPRP